MCAKASHIHTCALTNHTINTKAVCPCIKNDKISRTKHTNMCRDKQNTMFPHLYRKPIYT